MTNQIINQELKRHCDLLQSEITEIKKDLLENLDYFTDYKNNVRLLFMYHSALEAFSHLSHMVDKINSIESFDLYKRRILNEIIYQSRATEQTPSVRAFSIICGVFSDIESKIYQEKEQELFK